MTDDPFAKRFVPIRTQLLFATIVSGLLAVLIALAGLYCMHLLNLRLKQVVDVATEKVKLTHLLRQDLTAVMRAERNLLLVTDEKEFDRMATTMDANFDAIHRHVSQLRTVFETTDRQQLDDFATQFDQWKTNHQRVRQFSGMDAQRQARELSLGPGENAFDQFEAVMNQLVTSISPTNQPPGQSEVPPNNAKQPNPGKDDSTISAKENSDTDLAAATKNKLNRLAELRRDALKLQRVEKNLILQASITTVEQPEDLIAPFRAQVQTRLAEVKKHLTEPELKSLEPAETSLIKFLEINAEIIKIVQQKGNFFGFQMAQTSTLPLARACESIADAMVSKSEQSLDAYERESSSLYGRFRNALIGLSAFAIAASVIISMLVGNKVAADVRKLSSYARDVHRAKDLGRPVPEVSNDEIGELAQAFNEMRRSLLRQSSQLSQLNETLEQKNDEMEQFVYSVSHDLKSPLVSCKGLVGLIHEDIAAGDFDEVSNSAVRLSTVTDQMSDTIDDLLTFTRLGRAPLKVETVDTEALLTQLKEEWSDRLDEANIELLINSELIPIQADLISLRRVFENLIGNAVKYAGDQPDAKIEIGSLRHGNKVRYFVRDNGPGIEPEYHEKIFGLFQRLETSKKGTGIGLASVAKIMRLYSGRIWVESQPREGATFWIEFPGAEG